MFKLLIRFFFLGWWVVSFRHAILFIQKIWTYSLKQNLKEDTLQSHPMHAIPSQPISQIGCSRGINSNTFTRGSKALRVVTSARSIDHQFPLQVLIQLAGVPATPSKGARRASVSFSIYSKLRPPQHQQLPNRQLPQTLFNRLKCLNCACECRLQRGQSFLCRIIISWFGHIKTNVIKQTFRNNSF